MRPSALPRIFLLALVTGSCPVLGADPKGVLLKFDDPCSGENIDDALAGMTAQISGRAWFGLWKIDRQYWLKPAPLHAVKRNTLLPLEEDPLIEVSDVPVEGELQFYVSQEGLREGIVESVRYDDPLLELEGYETGVQSPGYGDTGRVGDPVTVRFRDQTYTFRIATSPLPGPDILHQSSIVIEKRVAPASWSGSYPITEYLEAAHVLWAGDYDRDGQMDVLFQMYYNEGQGGVMLMAGEGPAAVRPFRVVGMHTQSDCC